MKFAFHKTGWKQIRLNPEHKSCFKWVFCFTLRSFSEYFPVYESVMCPLTLIIKNIFNQFWVHFFTSLIHCDVNSQDTKFGSKIFNNLAVIDINVFQNQNRSWSKRVLNKTAVQDLSEEEAKVTVKEDKTRKTGKTQTLKTHKSKAKTFP